MNDETLVALANLDWLQLHFDAQLDFSSRAILIDGSPVFVMSDLAIEGLTPATDREGKWQTSFGIVVPDISQLVGKVVHMRARIPDQVIIPEPPSTERKM